MSVNERIFNKINELGLKFSDVADKTGIDRASFTRWKNEKYKPSLDAIIALSQFFNVSTDWLLTGKSPSNNISFSGSVTGSNTVVQGGNSANITVQNSDTPKQEISKQAAELLRVFENLNVRDQTKLLSIAFELESQNLK